MKNIPSELVNVAESVERTMLSAEKTIVPIRKTFFKRFPFTSVLFLVFGVTATSYGAELFFESVPYFVDHPLHLFFGGLFVLMIMGKLHQKFG